MARTSGTNTNDAGLTQAQIELLQAQAAATAAQPGQTAAELQAKLQIAMQQLAAEQGINKEKIGLGREEIGGRDRQAQLAAAIGLLDTGAKERIARQSEQGNIASDIAKDTSIPANIRAAALAESGQPGLYNALEQDKAAKRDEYIRSEIPAILKARDDAEREKIIKPRMELAFPGSFDVGRARAFPKAENESVRAASQAKRFEGTTAPATGGADYSGLIGTLLGKSGVISTTSNVNSGIPDSAELPRGAFAGPRAPGSPNQYPVLPNTSEVNYAGTGRGSLEGSTPVVGGIQTPSGGFIGGTLGADRLAKLITPRGGDITSVANANVNGATANPPLTPENAQISAVQSAVPFDKLLANNAPTMEPQIVQTPLPPGTINVDAAFSNVVGNPTMEDLRKRQQLAMEQYKPDYVPRY